MLKPWRRRVLSIAAHAFIWSSLVAVTLPQIPEAYAQDDGSVDDVEGMVDETLNEEPLIEDALTEEEAPPKPEYPYPGADEPELVAPANQAPIRKNQPAIVDSEPEPVTPQPGVERPKRITEEGEYYYDTNVREPAFSGRANTEAPKQTTKNGEFHYDQKSQPHQYIGAEGREKPVEMKSNGEFLYSTEESPLKSSASFRFGIFAPPSITNPKTGLTFEDVYGDNSAPVLMGDYEWRLTSKVGRLGIKFTSGVFFATGAGRFVKQDARRRADDTPDESFTFLMFPNQLTAIYKFQYSDTQWVVPYVEGGAGYFTFAELRDDNVAPKFGGAPVTVAAAGLNFLMDWVDRRSVRQLDLDYGINHVWFTAEFRAILGVDKDYDFSSNVINAGFTMDF